MEFDFFPSKFWIQDGVVSSHYETVIITRSIDLEFREEKRMKYFFLLYEQKM